MVIYHIYFPKIVEKAIITNILLCFLFDWEKNIINAKIVVQFYYLKKKIQYQQKIHRLKILNYLIVILILSSVDTSKGTLKFIYI